MIDHGRRIRGERPGLFEPQVGLVIALKQLWSDHELPGCSGRDMAPGGERPRGNAVPSGGAPVEQRLADWRREALADRSKRPKSSPWRVPGGGGGAGLRVVPSPNEGAARDDESRHRQRMELRALPYGHGSGDRGAGQAFDGCDVLTRRSRFVVSPKPNVVRPCGRGSICLA